MKNKKRIIIALIVIVLIISGSLITYRILNDENKLTSSEKNWINNNLNNIQNINVINDVNIFGNAGVGVFYDFLGDFTSTYQLQINPVTFNYGDTTNGLTLGIKTTLTDNDQVFFTDHFVLVSKNNEVIRDYNDFENKKIGTLTTNASLISNYLTNTSLNIVTFETEETLLEAFSTGEEIDYMIVPLTIYIDEILTNDYYIIYHLSDVNLYYTISGNSSDTLTSILKKYYLNWYSEYLDEYYKDSLFDLFTTSLSISETEIDAMQSVTYQYGFVNNSPYEVIMSGNYGGIIAMYLYDFGEFSDIDFNYTKYRNVTKFNNAINNDNVDLYFNYYNFTDDYYEIDSHILVEYSIIAKKSNSIVINSLNSLIGKTIYVQDNSYLKTYLSSISDINIETYEDESDLKKLNNQDVIIVLDKNIYDLYSSSKLSNYTERYQGILNDTYKFKSKTNSAFYKLFTKYVMYLDNNEMINLGMYNHSLTVRAGNILGTIAKYILITLAIFAVIFIIFYKKSKKIKVAKKIKKENKIKFIDQLTSLKNRNYLNEYINNWNNNTVYPQTMIVVDLNNIQFINDTLGYEEGDKQIKSAANILIKTQLDSSDIMRTDGNEFLIYLVGYTQKQVTNYIHKLNKEFKKLPYQYGAEFGYSMINDSIKTIEDAILEATEEMKKQKHKQTEE